MDIYDYIVILLIAIFFTISYSLGFTPLLLPIIFVLSSTLAFFINIKDKRAAEKGEWRTPESTLHLISLLCGWPGAFLAQKVFRHKTRKVSFQITFWVTVLANISLIAWFHTPVGSSTLHAYVRQLSNIVVSSFGQNEVSEVLLFCLQYKATT
ncbi:MAG: DUF1294 domain-containing protein [Gammaproteobacteria bacterium]|jgi:uncharacterized membrane protein YsdA (DUF1294 family)|nr:DUF1294 domain-containing protein [Gammaproteobacteria bacterium]MBT4494940.1 DUF1294 domain-containing protein [Gammaproteobacteria bacterium]